MQTPWSFYLGVGLVVGGLLTGCQSIGGGQDEKAAAAKESIESASPDGLDKVLASTGFHATNLVLRTLLPVPAVTNDPNQASAAWEGRLAQVGLANFQAQDRLLVFASNQDLPRYRFSAPLRTWSFVSDKREVDWQQIWYCGNVRDFMRAVRIDRASRLALNDALHEPAGDPPFPVQMDVAAMRTNLVEIGLTTLEEHLKASHIDASSCTPAVRVYLIPAAGTQH